MPENLYNKTSDLRMSEFGMVYMPVRIEDSERGYQMLALGTLLDAQDFSRLPVPETDSAGAPDLSGILAMGDRYGYFQGPHPEDLGSFAVGSSEGPDRFVKINLATEHDGVPKSEMYLGMENYEAYYGKRDEAFHEGRDYEITCAGRDRLAEICGAATDMKKDQLDKHLEFVRHDLGVDDRHPEAPSLTGDEPEQGRSWTISGCTPDDVTEVYGDRFDITPEAAAEIAGRVNAAVSGIDDLFSDVLNEQVIAAAGEGEIAPAGAAEIAEGAEGACARTAAADRAHAVQADLGRG